MAEMTIQEMQAELARLTAANAELKATCSSVRKLTCKVAPKGGLSVYGLGRFPLTLYRGQWEKLIETVPQIQAFITANVSALKVKE
jgi:hypothetical protein